MSKRRMPAEWEPHESTWVAWPHEASDWPVKFEVIPWVYAEIVRAIGKSERVEILCNSNLEFNQAEQILKASGVPSNHFRLHLQPNDRSWLRDSAPTAVFGQNGLEWIGWKFNSWAKYDNYSSDQHIPEFISRVSEVPVIAAKRPDGDSALVLEGGAIETDGQGTLLVTEECLLSDVQQRNPGLTRQGYEQAFAEYLGTKKTIWLAAGCEGDDTHGHIDDIARFVSPGKVVVVSTSDKNSPNYSAFSENILRLRNAVDAQGRPLEVIELPSPRRIVFGDEVLPASYANFYIANRVVVVPVFNDPADREALNILANLFPEREVVGICAVDLVLGQGTLHCLTQQQPQR